MFDVADAIRRAVMNTAHATGLDALARPLLGGVGAILMVHRVTAMPPARPDGPNRHLAITPAFLDAALAAMKADGFVFVSMDEALARLRAGDTGERFAAVTGDDGYRDNLVEALPVLEHHAAPFTVYVAPALTDRAVPLWWEAIEDIAYAGAPLVLPAGERVGGGPSEVFGRLLRYFSQEIEEQRQVEVLAALAEQAGTDPHKPGRDALMDWNEVRKLSAHPLVTIGAHTRNHYNLKRLARADAARELAESRDRLQAELGRAPRHFAFPYGYPAAAGPREAELAREAGFATAVTTRHGLLHERHLDHRHALPRISLNGRFQNVAQTRVMTRGFTTPVANRGRRVVTV